MGLWDRFKKQDIHQGVETFRETRGAVLLDVRTPEEYAEGHIEGSRNLPLQQIEEIVTEIPDRDTPLFVHCRSGARSARATAALLNMGYRNVTDIGGILSYRGKVVEA